MTINRNTASIYAGLATPPQFDNDTSLATTAFIQRALGNLQGFYATGTAGTLSTSHAGKLIQLTGSGGFTLTLPALSFGVSLTGTTFYFENTSSGVVTIATSGAETIYAQTLSGSLSTVTYIALNPGETTILSNQYQIRWLEIGGLRSANIMPVNSLAATGYQKFPSGLIFQWSQFNVASSAANTWTFPIAFPNAVLTYFGTDMDTTSGTVTFMPSSLTACSVYGWRGTAATAIGNCNVMAIGY